jgi:hypothetical protein
MCRAAKAHPLAAHASPACIMALATVLVDTNFINFSIKNKASPACPGPR